MPFNKRGRYTWLMTCHQHVIIFHKLAKSLLPSPCWSWVHLRYFVICRVHTFQERILSVTKGTLCSLSHSGGPMFSSLFLALPKLMAFQVTVFLLLLLVSVYRYHRVSLISPNEYFQVKCNVTHYHLPPNKGRTDHFIYPSCLRWHLVGLLVRGNLSSLELRHESCWKVSLAVWITTPARLWYNSML